MKLLQKIPEKIVLWASTILFKVRLVGEDQKKVFRSLWTAVWEDEGYAHEGEPLEEIEGHYAVFDSVSLDLLLYFLWIPIGTMRLVWETERKGLPVLNDFNIVEQHKGPLVEFTLLTLRREWRGIKHLPTLVLWREGYRLAKSRECDIAMAADKRLWHLMTRLFPFRQVGEEKFYEGSLTFPAVLSLREAQEALAEKNPELLRWFDPEAAQRLLK